ncbi:Protein kinase, partial [Phytophthora megakarya]
MERLSQRWTRFADEDLGTFVTCSALFTIFQTGKEFSLTNSVGIAGMKLSIAAVSHYRQDFSRDNVLMALPVCGALLNVHRGPRAMTMGAVGLAALGYGADYIFGL